VGVGSGLFHGNTSYGDGALHLKVESKHADVAASAANDPDRRLLRYRWERGEHHLSRTT